MPSEILPVHLSALKLPQADVRHVGGRSRRLPDPGLPFTAGSCVRHQEQRPTQLSPRTNKHSCLSQLSAHEINELTDTQGDGLIPVGLDREMLLYVCEESDAGIYSCSSAD
uniref:Uncharacterized protein n=1 Tax=Knipowitschia caucasica TaxID=637954 RepID=A0AAV2LG00_KNICA